MTSESSVEIESNTLSIFIPALNIDYTNKRSNGEEPTQLAIRIECPYVNKNTFIKIKKFFSTLQQLYLQNPTEYLKTYWARYKIYATFIDSSEGLYKVEPTLRTLPQWTYGLPPKDLKRRFEEYAITQSEYQALLRAERYSKNKYITALDRQVGSIIYYYCGMHITKCKFPRPIIELYGEDLLLGIEQIDNGQFICY